MQSHLILLVLFAFLVSIVFALLSRDDARGQVLFGARLFGIFVVSAVVLGWLLFPLPF